jgi:hypothetical protein
MWNAACCCGREANVKTYMPINKRLLLVFSALGWCGALLTGSARGADWKVLPGHVPSALSKLAPNGRLAATNQLRLAISVPLRDPAGLKDFLAQLYDPASPAFHQYLTPQEFTARFGPTESDYAAVKNFAQTNGLSITATYGNRLVLDVAGPATAVEKAFQITLHTYRHPTEARDFFAPDTEPRVDAALPVTGISGLNNYQLPHPKLHRQTAQVTAKGGSAPDGSSYLGNDFRAAYVPGVTLRGSGQIVGLLEFDGYYASDIASYESLSGYTNVPLVNVLLNSVSGTPGFSGQGADAIGEVSLDIEMAIAMAPALAKVIVYEGSQQTSILSRMVSDNQAKQISCSWGWPGGPAQTNDVLFMEMAAQGQSFFNASGDSDAFTAGQVDSYSQANAPSSSPYITQVGGTTLTTGTGASYSSETVWNRGSGVGSSGGISSYYSIPSWQTNINLTVRGGSATYRNLPDVALIAENVWVNYDQTTGAFGGTSCAAPLWAGFMALVNQQAAAAGGKPAGFINPAIYAIASGANYTNCFHDITTGNNFWSSSPGLFAATNGYDLCTGLGTPAGQNLINALAVGGDALGISPGTGFALSGPLGGPFNPGAGTFQLTNSGATALNWSLVNTSAWLTAAFTNGSLAANSVTNLNCAITISAGNLAVGNYSTTILFTNGTSHVVQSFPFTLQIYQPLSLMPVKGFAAVGPVGGPFTSAAQNFILTNLGGGTVNWSLINTSAWLSASPASGALASGGQAVVTTTLSAAAGSLAAAVYNANLIFTNPSGVVAVVPFTVSVGQPILQNGGFETGNFTGWTQSGNTGSSTVTSGNANYVHGGTYGAELGPVGPLGYLTQNLTTAAGQNYLLSLWLRNYSGGTPNQFQVQWNGATIFYQSNLTVTAWTNLQFLVTATGSATPLQFGFQNDPAYFGLDDVNVVPLAPATFKSTVKAANNFQLVWNTTAGVVYQVQYKTNLFQANWTSLGSAVTAGSNSLTLTDTNAFQSSAQRFYRLLVLP